jgi:WD40 repeat protein
LGTHGNHVYSVSFSPDGKYLASAGADNIIKIWDVAGQKEFKQLKGPTDAVTGAVFTADNANVVSIGFDRLIRIWNVASGMETKKLGPTADDLYGIALSRDGKALATSGYGGNLTVWNLTEGKATFTKKIKFGPYCISFSPDGKALVTGHDNHSCYITPIDMSGK